MDDPTTMGSIIGAGIAVAAGLHKVLDKLLPAKNGNGNGNGKPNGLESALNRLAEATDRHHDEEVKILHELVTAITVMSTKFDERMSRRDHT